MGTVTSDGLEQLIQNVALLPEALKRTMYEKGLDKAGEIISAYQVGVLAEEIHPLSGQLIRSVRAHKKEHYTDIYPDGSREPDERYKNTKRRYRLKKRGGSALSGPLSRNSELSMILHYGDGRRRGSRWMDKAADASVDDVQDAEAKIYFDLINTMFK